MSLLFTSDKEKVVLVFTANAEKAKRAAMVAYANSRYAESLIRPRAPIVNERDIEVADVAVVEPAYPDIIRAYTKLGAVVDVYEPEKPKVEKRKPEVVVEPAPKVQASPKVALPMADVEETRTAPSVKNKPRRRPEETS